MGSTLLPDAHPSTRRSQFTATVQANLPLCREHFKLVLKLADFPRTEPGQFIQVACCDMNQTSSPETDLEWRPGESLALEGRELMSPLAMLRRPFSLAGRRDTSTGVELNLIHHVVGIGTDWLSHLAVGDQVDILGPLGNRFVLPADGVRAILVGGGVGIPPMLYLAEKLAGRGAVAFTGALTRDLLPMSLVNQSTAPGVDDYLPSSYVAEFNQHDVASVVTTDDGSYGFRGFVTQALEEYLSSLSPASPIQIYTCGPEPMMKRVAQIAADRRIECQIAVERAMACGMGTCQSCCIRLKRDDTRDGRAFAGKDWIYKLACTDGPVFKGADLLW